ncbi:MAG: hypothetical protein QM765_29955 [Myxococcales bacterium]
MQPPVQDQRFLPVARPHGDVALALQDQRLQLGLLDLVLDEQHVYGSSRHEPTAPDGEGAASNRVPQRA